MKKFKIINENYTCVMEGTLDPLPSWAWMDKPWLVTGAPKPRRFPTHAEAIAYADKLARGMKK